MATFLKFNNWMDYLMNTVKYLTLVFYFYCMTALSLRAQEREHYTIQILILKTDASILKEDFKIKDFLECFKDDLLRYKIYVKKVYHIEEQNISESSIPSYLNRFYRKRKESNFQGQISLYNEKLSKFENRDRIEYDSLHPPRNFAVELGFNTKKHLSSILEVSVQWVDLIDSIYSKINQ